jgi:hypothetical protein
MPSLTSLAKQSKKPRVGPLWKGPESDDPVNGGITFSNLSRFLCCRERFRVLMVEGLKPKDEFKATIEYGQMWHACEEALAGKKPWEAALKEYCTKLALKYPMSRADIDHWGGMCLKQFPLYVKHWAAHPDVKDRTPLMQEEVFNVRYTLPSGRVVRLRGKFDSVDLIGKGKEAGVYIQENKTKSQIDDRKIKRQLSFDLQTMIYIVALSTKHGEMGWAAKGPISGVRYNVVRRSSHKSVESFEKKITEDMADGRVSEWFARWKVEITPADVKKFRRECFDNNLEQLCDWWEWISSEAGLKDPFANSIHWRHPFGVYNVLDEGGSSDLDEYLETGSVLGLKRVDELFPELK